MKKLLRPIKASEEVQNRKYTVYPSENATRLRFSPSEVVDLLNEIEELEGLDIVFDDNYNGKPAFIVGENSYTVDI